MALPLQGGERLMAKLYASAAFAVTRVLQTDAEIAGYGPTPGTSFTLDFDPATNQALVADLIANLPRYTYDGTTLKKSGVTTAVAAPGQHYGDRSAIAAILTKLAAGTALTTAELSQVLRWLVRNI